MTIQDFLKEFNEAQDAFHWECLDDGAIRGMLRSGGARTAFDPVTAVLFRRAGETPETDRARAARLLGLSLADSAALSDAADGVVWTSVDGETAIDGYSEWLREGLCLTARLDFDPIDPGAAAAGRRWVLAPPEGIPLEPEPQLQHF